MSLARPKSSKKIADAVPKTTDNTDTLVSLRTKLKICDNEVQLYVAALEHENFKMQSLIAKLQAENMTLNNRIKVLIKEKSDREAFTSFTVNLDHLK